MKVAKTQLTFEIFQRIFVSCWGYCTLWKKVFDIEPNTSTLQSEKRNICSREAVFFLSQGSFLQVPVFFFFFFSSQFLLLFPFLLNSLHNPFLHLLWFFCEFFFRELFEEFEKKNTRQGHQSFLFPLSYFIAMTTLRRIATPHIRRWAYPRDVLEC